MSLHSSDLVRLCCEEILQEAREIARRIAHRVEQVREGVPTQVQPVSNVTSETGGTAPCAGLVVGSGDSVASTQG
jgi:hypothetical protein